MPLPPQSVFFTQHLTREDFDYWFRQLPHDKSPGDDELTYEMWQEAEMKDALYQVVNQVVQNGKMPTSWEGELTTLISKKVGEETKFRIKTSDLPHEHSCQNSNERLGETTLQKPRATIGFRRLTGGFSA